MQNQSSTNHPGARKCMQFLSRIPQFKKKKIIYYHPKKSKDVSALSSRVTKIPILALHSRDPLLIRTSGITLSSSISQPNRRQLCSMLMHIHLGTSSLKTLHLGTLFFLFYLALTQNEENICDGKVTL
ncbi:SOSS complex subunit C isoform X4 [Trachypithecus francoisi]|nr:SOSS complex subunit C isoform X4 [Trachypithecus francoisi]XP_033093683.1 SOSS complex subunit C isoform X4 [Trachypithecus francoisi]